MQPRSLVRFGPLTIEYDQRVLTPRPWTLLQSRWAAELAPDVPPGPILELCAGAGHIGLVAAVCADRDLVQVEAEPVAAGYASANARRAGWSARHEVRVRPMQQALQPGERYPLILADPPYLPTAELGDWPQDPSYAIDGGADGLAGIRDCLSVAAAHLSPGGRVLLQVAGPAQAQQVEELLARPGQYADLVRQRTRIEDERRAVTLISNA